LDYVFSNQILRKVKSSKIIAQSASWDENKNNVLEEVERLKEFRFLFADTLIEYLGRIKSDQFIKPLLSASQDTTLILAGLQKGSLKLDSTLVAQTEHLSAFYLKVSRRGQLLGFQLIEQVDTLQGLQFSENQGGKVMLSTGFTQGNIRINGQSKNMQHTQGVLIAQMGEYQTRVIQEIGSTLPLQIKGIAYSSDTTQIGLLLNRVDTLSQSGYSLTATPGNHLSLLSLSAQGVMKWNQQIPSSNLDLSNLAFSNGHRKGLFVGLSFRDSLQVDTHQLKSKGQEDIAIVKYDSTGVIIQLDTFGTVDAETVSQMMLSENVLFFGGEMKGSTKNRSIGVMDFINTTAFDGRAYISAITDTLGANLPLPDTSIVIETAQLSAVKELLNDQRALQRSVAIFAFPNPFQDELNLQFQAHHNETWKLRLMDNLGAVVKQVDQQVSSGFNSTILSTSTLAPGMYFLQCVAPDGYVMQTIKVVKTR
jgi:hypothetical protein